jgi:hypothetical protein
MMQTASDKAAYRDSMIQQAQLAADAKIESARERGATQLQIAKMESETKRQIAQLNASLKLQLGANKNPEVAGKTYDNIDDKINDVDYGVARGKIPAKEQTIARRVSTDSKGVIANTKMMSELTNGGLKNVTGTVFANVKDNGFISATGKTFANTINPKESAMYDAVMYPLVKSMSLLSNPDYRPTQQDIMSTMQSYKANSGEQHAVQLQKMAGLRVEYENMVESQLDNGIFNPAQANALKNDLKEIRKVIPWTQTDVLNYMKDPASKTTPFKTWLNSPRKGGQGVGNTRTADDALINKYLNPGKK